MDILKILLMVVTMGSAPSFPDGDASEQKILADKIIVQCQSKDYSTGNVTNTDTLHIIKNHPKFKPAKKSYFSNTPVRGYFFLTQIDSSYLFIEDPDYSMLKYLRLMTTTRKLEYTVLDSVDHIVNAERLRKISWKEPIPVKIFEDNKVFETSFDWYTEYWQCGEKNDYAPKYPFMQPKKTDLRKNLTKEQTKNMIDVLNNPIFVFSIIPYDNSESYDGLGGKSVKMTLITEKGKEIEGRGIDINNDKVADAFWYVDVVDGQLAQWYARLYVNIMGEWTPVWYNYFREL